MRKVIFEANDGAMFSSAEECKRHEDSLIYNTLANRTIEEIGKALSLKDHKLAEALEKAGNSIAQRRRASGGLKRIKKGNNNA